MPAKVFTSDAVAHAELPIWQKAGVPAPEAAAEPQQEPAELLELRARVAGLEAAIPATAAQARLEGQRVAEQQAAQSEARLREEIARREAASAAELVRVRNEMRRQMEEDLVRLAVSIARRVVRRELTADPEALWGIAHAAIEQIEAREIHKLRVSPKDADLVRRLLNENGLPAKIQVAADAALETGALIFETGRGTVDASVEVQLNEIDRGLADVVRRSAS